MPCHSEYAEPIDAVITWVDGEDPRHKAKLNAFLGKLEVVPEIASADRYRETGEFAYCIASLLRFAPWLRRIWIVSDEQEPSFLATIRASRHRDRVVVVDHKEIFAGYEQHLPTFNNRTLLTALWRMRDLAPRFLYLNDDFALLRPVAPEDFFRAGRVVLRGRWCLQPWHQNLGAFGRRVLGRLTGRVAGEPRPSYHGAQALAALHAGYRWRYFRAPHAPHAQLRPLLAAYFLQRPGAFEANIRHRLRSDSQFLTDALGNHLALRQDQAVVDNHLQTLRLKPAHYAVADLDQRLARAGADERTAFTRLQSLEALPAARREVVFRWLERRIGRPEAIFRGETGGGG